MPPPRPHLLPRPPRPHRPPPAALLWTSLQALPFIAVATTVVFRNLGVQMVAFGDYIKGTKVCVFICLCNVGMHAFLCSLVWAPQVFPRDTKIALGVIFAGALVYAAYDMNYHYTGYLWISINTMLYAVSVHMEKWAVNSTDQTRTGVSCYQNLLSLPMALVLWYVQGENKMALASMSQLGGGMKIMIGISGLLGMMLSMCKMTLNKIATATAISIAGNTNKIVSSAVGAMLFHSHFTVRSIMGLCICVGGAMGYAVAEDRQAAAKKITVLPQHLPQFDGDDELDELLDVRHR
jgi:hypothetical protein